MKSILSMCLLIGCYFPALASTVPTLADVLAKTAEVAGAAPDGYATPFLVVSVMRSDTACALSVVTNGIFYSLSADRDSGRCDHLPRLHTLVWGRVRHSKLGSFLRRSNTANVASDYVDLVYGRSGPKPKIMLYTIDGAEEIGPEWGR